MGKLIKYKKKKRNHLYVYETKTKQSTEGRGEIHEKTSFSLNTTLFDLFFFNLNIYSNAIFF